ncbi:hypothetical protein [Pontibacter ramchanderi]|nr:hypothetical protein [Pontibacter ramchanderi]
MKKVSKKIKTILNSLTAQTKNRRSCTWHLYLFHSISASYLAMRDSGLCGLGYEVYTFEIANHRFPALNKEGLEAVGPGIFENPVNP